MYIYTYTRRFFAADINTQIYIYIGLVFLPQIASGVVRGVAQQAQHAGLGIIGWAAAPVEILKIQLAAKCTI